MEDTMTAINWQKMARNFGTIHLIGIGGIGISGIAEILHNLGCKVQGSDMTSNNNVKRIESLGIKVFIGHHANNIYDASVIVKSSAVQNDNPEIIAAKELGIPVISRAEMLAELMRLKISISISGTHGKTTTTSMVACMFESAGLEPTVINGGILNSCGTNAYLGKGDYLVAEADESDGTFINIPSTIVVITNIDPEHLDFYGSFTTLKNAFRQFIENIPFYGFAVACKDHSEVASLIKTISDRKIITYGLKKGADITAVNIKQLVDGSKFDVQVYNKKENSNIILKDFFLPTFGLHNIQNCLSAIAIGLEMKFSEQQIKNGLMNFKGVKRRFTKTGEVNNIKIIDDYAHHPKEITATLATAKSITNITGNKVHAICQPHRYTRVQSLFNDFATCFNDADYIYMADIYEAGEKPIAGIDSKILIDAIKQNHNNAYWLPDMEPKTIIENIKENIQSGDIIIFMGAGNITNFAYQLPDELEKFMQKQVVSEEI
jgi:UDP-N-acetylmuramate--alanine ligase